MGMGFGNSLRAAEDREGWKGIVATSSEKVEEHSVLQTPALVTAFCSNKRR